MALSILCFECHYAECKFIQRYAECHYAECHYTEGCCAECRTARVMTFDPLDFDLIANTFMYC